MLHYDTWGGGGWGDPLERDADVVALDVKRGLVSVEGARRYGVVCGADGVVDAAATEALRDKLRAGRGPLAVFNTGGEIEELRASCEAETGLKPPVAPKFRTSQARIAAE